MLTERMTHQARVNRARGIVGYEAIKRLRVERLRRTLQEEEPEDTTT